MQAFYEYSTVPFDHSSVAQSLLDIEGSRRVNALPWRGQFSPELVEALLKIYAQGGKVFDPFCGSGTSLMEAAHLGFESHGVEVNPAAYLLSRLYEFCNIDPAMRLRAITEAGQFISSQQYESAEQFATSISDDSDSYQGRILQAVFLLALGNGDTFKEGKLEKAFAQIENLISKLPHSVVTTGVTLGDARSSGLETNSIDTLLTSPPYVNVFNYHQNYRKAVEMLGWEVLPSARSEFGSNRKHRANRFMTVTQYAQDIGQALEESIRVVKPGGTSIWVVGRESSVRGQRVLNPHIVYAMATESAGLRLINKQERKFRSRYGALVYEDILVFEHPIYPHCKADPVVKGREVGITALLGMEPEDPLLTVEIEEAISKSEIILPSPLAPAPKQSSSVRETSVA